ncbi:MAG: PKD domain-containing protein, partial [Acidobacteria bacterium]|nr:PKD domain-containing protein [Acidobacteriota bacterium]
MTTASIARASGGDVVLYASKAPTRAGTWKVTADSTAAGGYAMENAVVGAPRVMLPLAQPVNYFQLAFPAYAGTVYHLWIRGKAADNSTNNDSVFVQFSDSVTASGSAIDRMGTTSAMTVILQSCANATVDGWGWADNGWCGLGANVSFQTTGTHVMRIQVREPGLSIDQIVLSPQTYLNAMPGKAVNDVTILAQTGAMLPSDTQVKVAANPSSGAAPLRVRFSSTVKLTSGSVRAYQWNFGDGQTSTAASPTHVFQNPGSYTAKLWVTVSNGSKANATTLITVSGGNGSFSDNFNSGSLDTSKWLASNGFAPGTISGVNYGSFVPSNVDLSKGMLCLKLQQTRGSSGVLSVGGELQSLNTYGYGTYDWVMRTSS